MVREVSRRLVLGGLLAAVGGPLMFAPAATAATPVGAPAPKPTAVIITGEGLAEPLTLRSDTNADLFAAVLGQVSWLTGGGQASSPKEGALGPKYTVVVLVNDVAKRTYDLYPLATGGPRAFRPGKQPDLRKTTPAWFYGRLDMSETLRAAGAPLPERPDVVSGGVGGGEREIPEHLLNPGEDIDKVLGQVRQMMLLNAGVVLVITLGLAGISLLVRRRTR